MTSPYETDIADQPRALTALLDAGLPDLTALRDTGFKRVVLTGMGSSHFGTYASWRTLLGSYPAAPGGLNSRATRDASTA